MTVAKSIFAAVLAVGCPCGTVLAGAGEVSPEQVFARVSPSVVTVRTFDDSGTELGQGSGVVVASAQVVTNCHVVRDSSRISIEVGGQALAGRWTRSDGKRDVCLLSVTGLASPPVALRARGSVVVGERVVAVGNPLGFGVAASTGLIVTIPTDDANGSLVTSAPVSPGSSGGGLFDLQGRLIGLTSAILGTGQNLNLVLALDGIDRLQAEGEPPGDAESIPGPEPRWVQDGDALIAAEDGKGLEAHARRWIEAQPTSAPARVALAKVLLATGRTKEAAQAVDEALRLDAHYSVAWVEKAMVLDARGDRSGAEAALTRASELMPSNPVPRRIRARWLFQAQRHAQAREEAQFALRLDAGDPGGWSLLGAIEDALGHHGDAARAYRIALRLDQHDPELRQGLARSLAKQGKTEDAKAGAVGRGAAMSEARTWHAIGSSELDRGSLGPAQDAFRKALELVPEFSPAWNGLGVVLTRLNRMVDAESAFTKALQFDPKNVEARANRASVRAELGRKAAALEDARQATGEAPQDALAWRVYGNINMEERNYQEAVVAFRKLDTLRKATPDDLVSLGESLAAVGKVPEGLTALRRAEEQSPRLLRLHLSMAKVLGNSGDVANALKYLDRAVEIEPSNVNAWSSRGYALMRLGRLPEAAEVLETAVRLAPESVNAWTNLGEAQMRRNNFGRAIAALEKAIALKPETVDARLFLAQSYIGTRQPAKAREQAAVVVARIPDQPAGLGILIMASLIEGNELGASQPYTRLRARNPEAARAIRAQAIRAGLPLASRLPE